MAQHQPRFTSIRLAKKRGAIVSVGAYQGRMHEPEAAFVVNQILDVESDDLRATESANQEMRRDRHNISLEKAIPWRCLDRSGNLKMDGGSPRAILVESR